MKIYKENPGKITYVLFDNWDDEQATLDTVRSDDWYGDMADEFYIVCDKFTDKLYDKLVNGGHVPRNVFIDNGGYVFLVTSGVMEERLNRIIYLDAFDMPEEA